MSEVSDHAIARLLIADFVVLDEGARLNVIGGGVSGIGVNPQTGFTSPFGVFVTVQVPPDLYNEQWALELVLEDNAGEPVQFPGSTGEAQGMRIAQNVTFQEPNLSAAGAPRRLLRSRFQWALVLHQGLPLPIGQLYTWRIRLDHATRDDWTEQMWVMGPPPGGPVLG